MSSRAQALSQQFVQANDEFVRFVERLSDDDLRRVCPDEQRTLAALARHVAGGYLWELRYFKAIADGDPLAVVTRAQLDHSNAESGEQYANADRNETLELLRRDGETAAQFVAGLTDEQLSQVGEYIDWIPRMSIDQWIERVLIGHIRGHLAGMRTVVDLPTPTA